jgi:hypothetical protein
MDVTREDFLYDKLRARVFIEAISVSLPAFIKSGGCHLDQNGEVP